MGHHATMRRFILCGGFTALLLAGCSWFGGGPTGRDVIAQASDGDKIAFDVVKIDDAVLKVLRAKGEPAFHERFKNYTPPPDIKIAVGDTVSVVIWEAAASGLFGNSLTEFQVSPGVTRRLFGAVAPGTGAVLSAGQSPTDGSRELMSQLFGGPTEQAPANTQANTLAQPSRAGFGQAPVGVEAQPLTGGPGTELGPAAGLSGFGLGTQQTTPFGRTPGEDASTFTRSRTSLGTPGAPSRSLQELLEHAVESGRPGTRIPDQQVGPDGAISIPYAGRIAAAGHTPSEVERAIEKELGPKALEPHAIVAVRRSVANSVSVAGEALRAGRIPLSPGGDRLLQVIAAASGGAAVTPPQVIVQLSRNGASATVPLAPLVGQREDNTVAEPADVLTLVRRPKT